MSGERVAGSFSTSFHEMAICPGCGQFKLMSIEDYRYPEGRLVNQPGQKQAPPMCGDCVAERRLALARELRRKVMEHGSGFSEA